MRAKLEGPIMFAGLAAGKERNQPAQNGATHWPGTFTLIEPATGNVVRYDAGHELPNEAPAAPGSTFDSIDVLLLGRTVTVAKSNGQGTYEKRVSRPVVIGFVKQLS